jgi:quinol-cytochrome oxidoreductase complex cytochrome b subunit
MFGGVIVPSLLLVALIALPYIDQSPKGIGVWFSGERKVAITLFTVCVVAAVILTIIGTYFRGPNWDWVWPWLEQAHTGH